MVKHLFSCLIVASVLSLPALVVSGSISAQVNPIDSVCNDEDGKRKEALKDSPVCNESDAGQIATEQPLVGNSGVLTTTTNILSMVAGIIAVIIIVIAGIQMTLSGGDGQKVSNSRNTIIYAAVGITVIVVARGLVLFIINRIG
jgi:hypothetical protein